MSYNALLFLSGGKDSCYLAYKLAENKNILAFTANLDILSDVARRNIDIVVKDLDLDHIAWRANQKEYQENIRRFFNEKRTMQDVCLQCSIITQKLGVMIAKAFNIKDIYLGFNKYNHGGGTEKLEVPPFTINNPLAKDYPLKEMEELLESKGIVTDVTKTNCTVIEKIIQLHTERFGENPFKSEIDSMSEDGLITPEYKKTLESFGRIT